MRISKEMKGGGFRREKVERTCVLRRRNYCTVCDRSGAAGEVKMSKRRWMEKERADF